MTPRGGAPLEPLVPVTLGMWVCGLCTLSSMLRGRQQKCGTCRHNLVQPPQEELRDVRPT